MKEITVYMKVSVDSAIAGPFEFSNPYWDGMELAAVSVHGFTDSKCWGVTISGCDDGGLVYVAPHEGMAFQIFHEVIAMGEISVDKLLDMGFEDADSAVIGDNMNQNYEIRSIFKDPVLGTIVSYGSYDTEKQARKALQDLATRNFANAAEIRSLGLELIQYSPMVIDRISALDMETA